MDTPLIVVNHEKVFLDLMHESLTGEGFAVQCWHADDATFARLFDRAGIEVLLVGDSLGNVIQGQTTTLPVTMDQGWSAR